MAFSSFLSVLNDNIVSLPLLVLILTFHISLAYLIYNLFFHPLSHIPGPLLARLSPLYLFYITYVGQEARIVHRLHNKYGPVVRIAPNEVSVSDGRALKVVYTDGGGMRKANCYRNFDIDGFPSIFSELEKDNRAVRAKSVAGLFSTSAIRKNGEMVIREVVERWVIGIKEKRDASLRKGMGRKCGDTVDLLRSARALALDAVTGYLFGTVYGALQEDMGEKDKLSAALFVDSFVAVGRFFYLPMWAFTLLESLSAKSAEDKLVLSESMETVDDFVTRIVEQVDVNDSEENTYQARMLRASISKEETKAQCKDLMFAGTDSTGMNLATICWHLSKSPEKYARLRAELLLNPLSDPQTLPYLSGVIKEGLRLSMANPTRMPRVVPSSGIILPSGQYLPPSIIIGLQPYSLHFNPAIFPSPQEFIPERWLDPTPEMLRDHIPFGLGSRACIARNLATVELFLAVDGIVRADILKGAKAVGEKIEILEWFNSRVVGERVEIAWL
ncbi:cytochrome P450 [Glonium stellatum]|uniref:Cytochrome P450 n=1 Tax=Glonium stellatum TaxID=574774 RepID=A0A8E2FE50_9PEZI|nr:cytochrome P450 [Glonium stellatum]